jgi:hypothetical protein
VVTPVLPPPATLINLIQNWFEALKAKVPAGGAKQADDSAPALPAPTVERLWSAPVVLPLSHLTAVFRNVRKQERPNLVVRPFNE